jgi:GT2 family glycosyltransferase
MSVKRSVHETYKKVKYSNKWRTNRFLVVIRPLFDMGIICLIFCYQKIYLPLKRSSPGRAIRTYRSKVLRQFKSLDITSIILKFARLNARSEKWRLAQQLFSLALKREVKRKSPRLENINEAKFNLSVINRILNISFYKDRIEEYKIANTSPRIAIYTAIAGDYDTIKLPEVLIPNVDYYLFTDKPAPDTGIFKIRPLPYFHVDTPRMTRYVKTHPHQLLPGYDLAIWIDANILITGDISPLIDGFVRSKKPVGAIQHPIRSTVHEEAKACIFYNKEDERSLRNQVEHYKALNYETNELIESNILMFDLNSDKVASFLTTWWSEIDTYTRRDQLSLNYSLDTHKIRWHKIMKRPHDARNHPLFTLVPHSARQKCILTLNQLLNKKSVNPYEGPSFAKIKNRVLERQKGRRIDIIYCVHNALPDVKICLSSVAKHRKSPNLKLIIVDDGSDSPTADFLKNFKAKHTKWVKLLRNESGSGYTKAANQGLKASTGEFMILLNSDTIVTDGWSEKMAEAVYSSPGTGIVGPLSSAASHQSIPNHIGSTTQTATNQLPAGLSVDDINRYCEKWSVADFYPRVPLVHGFCFGVTREVIDRIGYFDEASFPNGYGEENDYCFRAVDAGIDLVIATNTYIFHAKSKSYQDERRIKLMKQGNEKLRELRGKERITRAIKSVLANPYLQKFRDNTRALYSKH